MIVTITLNPAVDQTARVDTMRVGGINRLGCPRIDAAGKGINVARMAHRLGGASLALGIVAGDAGSMLEHALDREQVPHAFVRAPGETRMNLTVVHGAGAATSFFGPGPSVSREVLTELFRLALARLAAARVLVLAGSLPPGAPEETYVSYIEAARRRGVAVIVDTDGPSLRAALGACPDLIKPNVEEAERLVGRRLPDLLSRVEAARELAAEVPCVVLSMGHEGAVCVKGERAFRIFAPQVQAQGAVGAGDSMVAGLAVALGRGGDLIEALRLGAAAGAATASSTGTAFGTAEQTRALLGSVHVGEFCAEPPSEVVA